MPVHLARLGRLSPGAPQSRQHHTPSPCAGHKTSWCRCAQKRPESENPACACPAIVPHVGRTRSGRRWSRLAAAVTRWAAAETASVVSAGPPGAASPGLEKPRKVLADALPPFAERLTTKAARDGGCPSSSEHLAARGAPSAIVKTLAISRRVVVRMVIHSASQSACRVDSPGCRTGRAFPLWRHAHGGAAQRPELRRLGKRGHRHGRAKGGMNWPAATGAASVIISSRPDGWSRRMHALQEGPPAAVSEGRPGGAARRARVRVHRGVGRLALARERGASSLR